MIDHICMLWTWGSNTYNCLGHDSIDFLISPKLVINLSKLKIIDVGFGDNFMVAIGVERDNKFESIYSSNFRKFISK